MLYHPNGHQIATLAGGSFECLESNLRTLEGVSATMTGYTGGLLKSPSHEAVKSGKTGHAEAVRVAFEPGIIGYGELLEFFMTFAHNPMPKDRQGLDIGPQYRSVIFYHDANQRRIAESMIARLNAELFKKPVATQVLPVTVFWPADPGRQCFSVPDAAGSGESELGQEVRQAS
jgi:peptide-methionine (S)-S-oxide reductase